jgi:SOS response regulatory protein OraA/RecX
MYSSTQGSACSSFLRQLQRKRLGPSQIRLRLLAKGISAELIQELLETELRADHSSTSIQELLEGRYRSRDLRDPKERQRVASALLRKGFSPPDVWDALNQTSLSSSDSAYSKRGLDAASDNPLFRIYARQMKNQAFAFAESRS